MMVPVNPFDACWDRLDRIGGHRVALAQIWNDFIESHPFEFDLVHHGQGVHVLEVHQIEPMPPSFALEFGECLYNARTLLDYIVWATAACVSQQLPPPDEGTLQYPVYDSLDAWNRNEYRLKRLAEHHREMLLRMQPFNSDLDANYLGAINRLARIDRHRRLLTSTAYLAEVEPVTQVPHGCNVALQWGQRVLVDGYAQVARITVSPWSDDTVVVVNPRIGIDPDGAEWADSPFWRRVPFAERLRMIEVFLSAEIAVYEYDCTGASRKAEALSATYRAECDQRGPYPPLAAPPPFEVTWGPVAPGRQSSYERFLGMDSSAGSSTRQ
jgi:hypothetical protein